MRKVKIKKEMGERMNKLELAYCNECEDLVEYDISEEEITEQYKGETISYYFEIGKCKCCSSEVATDIEYNSRKSEKKISAYKRVKGIIELDEITEILRKYDVGKETLAEIAGFGKVTIKRYYDGFIPAKEYSDVLVKMLNDEEYFIECVRNNKGSLKEVAYNKIITRYGQIMALKDSKIDQNANYIVTRMEEVTPLALEKLLYFANGVNYARNGKRLIDEECQAWQHGPVYPVVYNKYKKYGYKPIDNGIDSRHGCMLSLLSEDELQVLDLVISTFGLFAPKMLEQISHSQTPWLEKRTGYAHGEAGKEVIDEDTVRGYYVANELSTKMAIMQYIMRNVER